MQTGIIRHKIESYSSERGSHIKGVKILKRNSLSLVKGVSIDGDAPKMFVGIYDYDLMHGKHKRQLHNWPKYIAKTGHKRYPSESITELLLNRLGAIFGLNVAEAELAVIKGQLRFLSRYFLQKGIELVHGADIIAGYLNESPNFVDRVDSMKLTTKWFTLQFIEEAIGAAFPYQKEILVKDLVKLLIFDALVGNNDRHFFNWGVVRSLKSSFTPYFSPIYDTARGLFWNDTDEKLQYKWNNSAESYIKKYSKASKPKIGWEGVENINHFVLFERIYKNTFYFSKDEIKTIFLPHLLEEMIKEIDENFQSLMVSERRSMIKKCLEYRFNYLKQLL